MDEDTPSQPAVETVVEQPAPEAQPEPQAEAAPAPAAPAAGAYFKARFEDKPFTVKHHVATDELVAHATTVKVITIGAKPTLIEDEDDILMLRAEAFVVECDKDGSPL